MTSKSFPCTSLLMLFPLSLLSISVHAGISTDCGGSSYCTNKVIDANSEGYIDKTPVYFLGDSKLTVSASQAFNNQSGIYEFRGNTNVDVNASLGLNGGTYTLRKDSNGNTSDKVVISVNAEDGILDARLVALEGSNAVVNLNQEGAINGGNQVFNAGTTLNINASNGIYGSDSLILTDATLNLNATEAFDSTTVSNAASIKGGSSVNVNASDAITGGQLNIQDASKVNINSGGSISGGTLLFTGESELNVQASSGVTGEDTAKQIFQKGTTLNVNALNGIAGGNQILNDATLNVNATSGISGGKQIIAQQSVMNLNADQAVTGGVISAKGNSTVNAYGDAAIIGGTQVFTENSTINAIGHSVIEGGTQSFMDNSILNASGQNVLSGGVQLFSDDSTLNGNNSGVISGQSQQVFSGQSVFNVNAEEAVSGGKSTIFKEDSVMNINESRGVVDGDIVFDGNASLNINAKNAITGGSVRYKGDSLININSEDALINHVLVAGGNSTINVNANNAMPGNSNITLQKTFDSTKGTQLNVNSVSLAVDRLIASEGTTTNINNGQLSLFEGGYIYGSLVGGGDLNVNGGVLSLKGDGSAMTGNITIDNDAKIRFVDSYNIGGNIINRGGIIASTNNVGRSLTVKGNYEAHKASLTLNAVLEGDGSSSDKIIVNGKTSGKTTLKINNIGGNGAQTNNGIEVVHVDGSSDGEFVQEERLLVGSWDYILGRGQGDNYKNWYLTSARRPEVGSYISNIDAVNNMFVTGLYDRLGKMQYIDVITGEQRETSMWMRHEGGHYNWRDGSGQMKTQSNRYVLQMGGDFAQWSTDGSDRWHLGLMAGYGNEHSSTDSVRTGYRSKGNVKGYSTGLYATWYADDETRNGAYLDTWAQYSWFDNQVNGDGLQSESYKSKGLTASLEGGYTWKAGQFVGSNDGINEWFVQPQAQMVWMDVKADEHQDSNGNRVESLGDGNVRTRLGVKTWIKSHNKMDDGKFREFNPFIEANWLHNTRDFSARMDGVTTKQAGGRDIGEVKVGLEGQITSHLNMWGNVGVQVGDKGYNNTSAMLGLKYTF
ncbi:autotransporter outer membrane beta-barrel domain-containing protein [Salmonella enterica]|uniref:autotransporter outer membrane beta-barrel domain-containing protein n=1 Tax=Salmonella enterica TaxID=28901 RepID=UPI000EF1334E|nr:autotransporter outer membrane beta-barrel domain-containing protein [Salmonella enterica]RLP44338.1 autotransporter outer membrane beta-barrel domain-containing protein [Salmonella enterica subsp. enterica serovar Typhi]